MKTKKYALILGALGALFLTQSIFAQKSFEIKANIANAPENAMAMILYMGGKSQFDTARIHKGIFSFKGELDKPMQAALYIVYKDKSAHAKGETKNINLYIDPGTTTITGEDLLTATITGGPTQKEFTTLSSSWQAIGWKEGNPYNEVVSLKKDSASLNFINQHPSSEVSVWAMEQLAKPDYLAGHRQRVKEAYQKMDTAWQHSKRGATIAMMIKRAGVLGIGMPAIYFESTDTSGHKVKLSDFKGKYVLVDFWASWCKPCRAENPNVLKNYEKYKDKNFTIIGVSLDDAKAEDKWKEAVRKDGLPWTQVSDLEGWKSKIATDYQVNSIPINYLIDPNGKIIAVGLRGEEMDPTLEKLLK